MMRTIVSLNLVSSSQFAIFYNKMATPAHLVPTSPGRDTTEATANIDIIFVHGLTRDPDTTWLNSTKVNRRSQCWPREWLPQTLPNARVLLFNYHYTFSYKGSLQDAAHSLLDKLRLDRASQSQVHIWNLLILAVKYHSTKLKVFLVANLNLEKAPSNLRMPQLWRFGC